MAHKAAPRHIPLKNLRTTMPSWSGLPPQRQIRWKTKVPADSGGFRRKSRIPAEIQRIPAEIQKSGGNPADSGGNPEIRRKSKCHICVIFAIFRFVIFVSYLVLPCVLPQTYNMTKFVIFRKCHICVIFAIFRFVEFLPGFPPESAGFPPELWISAGIRRNLVREEPGPARIWFSI